MDIDLDEFQGEIDDIARRKCEAASEKVDGFVMVSRRRNYVKFGFLTN